VKGSVVRIFTKHIPAYRQSPDTRSAR
jgi:hypothetical protein